MAGKKKIGAALVLGGGVGGMQAALDLADAGIKAYLLEEKGSIGGHMVELDKTFPTNDCAMCTIAPRLVTIERHLNVEMLTNSVVENISGEAGNFTIRIRKKTRYVDMEKCTGCGICMEKCPIKISSEFDQGLSKRKAIYTLFPQAVPNVPVIDKENCTYFRNGKCRLCEKFCDPKAVDFNQKDEVVEIKVGAVIITSGYNLFDAKQKQQLGFGRFPNVLTSLQFERMLSASGPTGGELMRLSDREVPEKLAFIQCVGSRETAANFCSAVCCMYATKEAIIVKEHHPKTEVTIFFIDIRAYGKGFEAYYERAKELGIHYVRCQPSNIKEEPTTSDLLVRYEKEDGRVEEECFNQVILSCGLRPRSTSIEMAEKYDIKMDEFGYCATELFTPVDTSVEGIYAAGVFGGPKDIPETVIEASSAASRTLALLTEKKGEQERKKEYPEERDISSEEPKIGVIVCHCGKNIASVVNIDEVVEYTKTLPGVVYVENQMFACATDSGVKIQKAIEEHGLNRMIIAACTPRTHEPLFQDTMKEAGLNPYLLDMANIRNQCSWVHMNQPELATAKAKDIIKLSVVKSRHLIACQPGTVKITKDALVIGGGIAGMTAALELADQGFTTHLLEKTDELGGNLKKIYYLPKDAANPAEKLKEIIENVNTHKGIKVYKNADIKDFEGSAGDFKVTFEASGKTYEIEHGAVIVATGGEQYTPNEFLYGQNDRVITQRELEEKLINDKLDVRSVVMLQCVGSRDEDHPYCSRICCIQAIKNAIKIKDNSPEANVFIIYRDIRAYSLNESEYTRARELGIRFLRFEDDEKPEVSAEGNVIRVSMRDPILNARLNIKTELLVLSAGIVPNEDNEELGKKLKLPLTEDKFFLEAHIKMRPVDFATDGVFLCGLAHSPKSTSESIVQASAAAARASAILSRNSINTEARVSSVIDENCDGCAYCVDPCPFNAITLFEYRKNNSVKKVVQSDPNKCKGCGVCMATCPKKGITVKNFSMESINEMVDAAIGIV